MTENTGSTRHRIQLVALELFTEQGYEKTSLREIAERLGVTKAALYYHFKSKDDIVNGVVLDHLNRLDELIRWAQAQPADQETRRVILRRYADDFFANRHRSVMRFFEQNQTVLKSLPTGQQMRERMMLLAEALARPDASLGAQLRAALSLFAVHSVGFAIRLPEVTDEQRRQTALEVAYELLDRIDALGEVSDAGDTAPAGDPSATPAVDTAAGSAADLAGSRASRSA